MEGRAARLVEHGKPLQVETVTLPEPGPDEVTVEMAYGAVNPVDRYGALGRVAPDAPLPRTLGVEGAGTVGGRKVMVRGYGLGTARDGLWASQAVVPAAALIDVPDGVDMKVAAAMGVAGVTAWRCATQKAGLTASDRVLVLGASGGVGSIIVSIGKAIGAEVWGQTGSQDKEAWVRERGADRVVVAGDRAGVVEACAPYKPTVVFDALGDGYFGAAIEVLAERGRLVTFGTSADTTGEVPLQMIYRKGLTVLGYAGLIEDDESMAGYIQEGLDAAAHGRMEIVTDRVLPLADVNQAFDLIVDRGVRGKILLDLAGA